MRPDPTRWRLQANALEAASAVIVCLPNNVQWGLSVTDEDTTLNPSTLNIFAYDPDMEAAIFNSITSVIPGKWQDIGESLQIRYSGLLVSILRQWGDNEQGA